MVWRVCGILCVCVCACVGLCVSGQCFLNETSRNLLSMSVCNLEVISFAVLVCVCVCVSVHCSRDCFPVVVMKEEERMNT